MKKFISITDESVDSRLDRWFKRNISKVPQSLIEKNIRKGNIKVNFVKEKSSYKLKKNDKILLTNIDFSPSKHKKSYEKYKPTRKDLSTSSNIFIENNDAGWSHPYNQIIIPKQEKSKEIERGNNNQIVDDTHGTTIQQKLPISNTLNRAAMTQGILNPNLKNTTKMTMNIE